MTRSIEIENGWRDSAIGQDLKRVRNVKPLWSKFGTAVGVALGGLDMWTNTLFGFSFFGTLKHGKTDAAVAGTGRRSTRRSTIRSPTAC